MQLVRFGEKFNSPIVIALGFFGCMHKGHVQLLDEAKKLAKQTNSKVALFTFSNNHLKVLGKDVKQLYPFEERCKVYQNLGIEVLISAQFDKQFMSTNGQQFLDQLASYNLQGVVCGFDYTCGSDRKNCQFVSQYLYNVPVKIVDAVCQEGIKISTTFLRGILSECKIQQANTLLSQPFFFDGKVVYGRGIGKDLGFPTANIQVDTDKFLPTGVFAGSTVVDGNTHKVIVNIGAKPTYDIDSHTVEVHIIDFEGNLYGKEITVMFYDFLRPEQKFADLDALKTQIAADIAKTRTILK